MQPDCTASWSSVYCKEDRGFLRSQCVALELQRLIVVRFHYGLERVLRLTLASWDLGLALAVAAPAQPVETH